MIWRIVLLPFTRERIDHSFAVRRMSSCGGSGATKSGWSSGGRTASRFQPPSSRRRRSRIRF
jgi:hypothetical protein